MAVKEGLAYILNQPPQDPPSNTKSKDPKGTEEAQSVFYNPIQQFNRDLSVLAIRAYREHVQASKKRNAEKRKQIELAKGKKRKRDEGAEKDTFGQDNKDIEKTGPEQNNANDVSASGSRPEQSTFTVLDALSATGLRALRYAAELASTTVVANDLSPSALESMKVNIEYNQLEKLIRPNHGDARAYMYSQTDTLNSHPKENNGRPKKFDVIDLDPYGTAAPFMDAAVQGVKDGGLLCVTCTDAGVWASTGFLEKAYALYGGVSCKGPHSHEAGLRLILHGLANSAAKYGLAIEPLLSLSIDFYARVFVRVHQSPAEVKFLAPNTMLVYNCDSGCGAWSTQPLAQTKQKLDKKGQPFYHYALAQGPASGPCCEHCGFKTHVGGPMWAGPLHNQHFIQNILAMLPGLDRETYQTVDRIEGMLTTAIEEDLELFAPAEVVNSGGDVAGQAAESTEISAIIPRTDPATRDAYPFFFTLNALSKVLHTSTMPYDAFRGALRHLGYRSTRSHTKPNTVRTDAPWDVIWEIMREWVRQKSPVKPESLRKSSAGAAILAKSREHLQKTNEGNQALSALKKEILTATESGTDVGDLVTKIEAALYRAGTRLGSSTEDSPASRDHQEAKEIGQRRGSQDIQGQTSARPHPSTLEVVFDEALGREPRRRLVRYQINPRENWGPMSRAK